MEAKFLASTFIQKHFYDSNCSDFLHERIQKHIKTIIFNLSKDSHNEREKITNKYIFGTAINVHVRYIQYVIVHK